VTELICAPGNPGIADLARCARIDASDGDAVVSLTRSEEVDLVVIGPEAPLVAGVTDAVLASTRARVFGPTRAAAELEGSKSFAKDVMTAAGVPTATHWSGTDPEAAEAALDDFTPPYVVKADGLAAGKGVTICPDVATARAALHEAMVGRRFGDAGSRVVIEEFLDGPEVSLFGLCDGRRVVPLAPAQDYKRIFDGDEGPNTGGMGAYSPVPAVDDAMVETIVATTMQPVVDEMARRGRPFTGVLYAGLVLTANGPRVLEFNVRFGDPETQAVLPRLRSDLAELLWSAARGELAGFVAFSDQAAVTVVAASANYPASPVVGEPVEGLEVAQSTPGALVFHAGTRAEGGTILTAGGRVLSVTGLGTDIDEARRIAYHALAAISFPGLQARSDIAAAASGTLSL
jgi:phosphoribosylamine--glycine ligase